MGAFKNSAVASLDEQCIVLTDFTEEELEQIRNLVYFGQLPSAQDKLSLKAESAFLALALDLNALYRGLPQPMPDVVIVKPDPDFAYSNDGEIFDDSDEPAAERPKGRHKRKVPSFGRDYGKDPISKKSKPSKCTVPPDSEEVTNSRESYFYFPQEGNRDLTKLFQVRYAMILQ